MKNKIIASAAALLATAASMAAVGGTTYAAHAAPAAGAPINTYSAYIGVAWSGRGQDTGQGRQHNALVSVELSPSFGFELSGVELAFTPSGTTSTPIQGVLAGDQEYYRSGTGGWQSYVLAPAQLSVLAAAWDPYTNISEFDQLPGVRQLSPAHYSVTVTLPSSSADLNGLLNISWGVTSTTFDGTGISELTLNLYTNRSGQLVKLTGSGESSTEAFNGVFDLWNFNQPVTITAP